MKEKRLGQIILEVIVSVGIITVVLLGAVAATTRALKTARVASSRAEALAYANRVMEKIKIDKESDVEAFFNKSDCNSYDGVTGSYTLDASCTGFGSGIVDVSLVVSWPEGDTNFSVSLDTKLTKTKF